MTFASADQHGAVWSEQRGICTAWLPGCDGLQQSASTTEAVDGIMLHQTPTTRQR
jgi:hypothetical protein